MVPFACQRLTKLKAVIVCVYLRMDAFLMLGRNLLLKDEMNSILETSAAEMELKCEGIASDLLSLLEKQQTAFDFQRNQVSEIHSDL